MPALSVMFKTVSTDCNLDCNYCYYRQSHQGKGLHRIDPVMLEAFMPQFMEYVADTRRAVLGWQGGEPTLAGLDFFYRVVELEARHAHSGTAISNMLQTNATLLDNDWGQFLKTYDFLIGVSLDGPAAIHNRERKDHGGHGSFHRVMAGIDILRRHSVAFNILCVIGPHNVACARELMRFFRGERFTHVQFIPAMGFQATEPDKPPAYLISPEAYGEFLVQVFDEWYEDGLPTISIRTFDNFLQSYLGVQNDLCVHSEACDSGLVVEYNGDVYPCDLYVHPQWRLGNICQQPLKEMAEHPARRAFIRRKHLLPAPCQTCPWVDYCHGGCVRNRRVTADGHPMSEYFCPSYQLLFHRAHQRLQALSQRVRNYQLSLHQLGGHTPRHRISRNAPCLCGSSRKYKNCCGAPALSVSYLFQPRHGTLR